MTFNPQLPIFCLMLIIVITISATIASIWLAPKLKNSAYKFVILSLRITAIILLFVIVLNPVEIQKNKQRIQANKDILLVDASMSMNIESPVSRLTQLKSLVNEIDEANKQKLIYYAFDTLATKINEFKSISELKADGDISNLASAIENILNVEDAKSIRNLIVCSDGRMNDKNKLEQVIRLARGYNVPVSVLGIGQPTELFNTAIKECNVTRHASPNTQVPVKVYLENKGSNNEAFELSLINSKGEVINKKYGNLKDGVTEHNLLLTTGLETEKYQLQITPMYGELTAMDNSCQFKIEVSDPKIRVLYMEGTNVNYRKSANYSKGSWPAYRFIYEACKKTGRIEMDAYVVDRQQNVGGEIFHVKTGKKGYPKTKEALFKYDVIICSDINRFVFNDLQLEWTRELVAKNGGGFCMIGGNTSFGSGGYDKTIWEQMIPTEMKAFNKGQLSRYVSVSIPQKSHTHPIWQIVDDLEKNKTIIKSHPPFRGTNIVNRAKPGATVLAYWKEYKNMPLICVQPYGKGRSMAFTSDAAGGWGVGYQDSWGSQRGTNNYYEKFWVNAVLWLAENSQANKQKKLICNSDKLSYYPTDTIRLEAEVTTSEDDVTIQTYFLNHPLEKDKLKFNRSKQLFVGNMQIPEKTKEKELALVCNAISKKDDELSSDTLLIAIKRVCSEYKNPNPDFKALEQLMVLTGGKNIQSADDINNLLERQTSTKSNFEEAQIIPAWDNWWLWLFIILFLSSEWFIRKFYI